MSRYGDGRGSYVVMLIMSIIFFLVGCGFIFGFTVTVIDNSDKVSTQATVIHVDVWYDDGLKAQETYEYYVDDVKYVKKSSSVKSANASRYEGQTFTVRYDPNDPDKVFTQDFFILIILGFGIIFASAGV
ncbi:MAG: DUF3592 domain-containing protein, partial [Clostridia bacterium]|nr:DUF3592 domain-containing protein [Clostridia bacterium]